MNDRLVERLAAQSAWRVPDEQLRRYLPQLLAKPDVGLQESTEMIEKPYGTIYRRHLAVTLPDETLDSWISQMIHAGQTRRRLRACAALATIAGWLSGLMMIVKLDRWTMGYHRRTILLGALALLVCATCVGWMMILG